MAERVRTWCRELTSHSAAEAQAARSAPVVGVDFPGSQPVSLSASNLALLEDGALDYLVSWKADGTRYLLLLLHGGAYLLDRAGRVRRCQMRFPAGGHEPGKPHKPLHTHEFTLLDGEMVVNVGPGGERRRVFLAYDCCALGRTCTPGGQLLLLTARPFRERYQAIESVAAAKHHFDAAARERYLCGAEPFRLERKPFFEPERAQWLLGEMRTLPHPCDGLMFQPGSEPYLPRTNEHLLKWKAPELNTVDFRLDLSGEEEQLQLLGEGGRLKSLGELAPMHGVAGGQGPLSSGLLYGDAEPGESSVVGHGAIAECKWDALAGKWSLLRIRRDKEHPNHESVFRRVWQSICDNLQVPELLERLQRAKPGGEP